MDKQNQQNEQDQTTIRKHIDEIRRIGNIREERVPIQADIYNIKDPEIKAQQDAFRQKVETEKLDQKLVEKQKLEELGLTEEEYRKAQQDKARKEQESQLEKLQSVKKEEQLERLRMRREEAMKNCTRGKSRKAKHLEEGDLEEESLDIEDISAASEIKDPASEADIAPEAADVAPIKQANTVSAQKVNADAAASDKSADSVSEKPIRELAKEYDEAEALRRQELAENAARGELDAKAKEAEAREQEQREYQDQLKLMADLQRWNKEDEARAAREQSEYERKRAELRRQEQLEQLRIQKRTRKKGGYTEAETGSINTEKAPNSQTRQNAQNKQSMPGTGTSTDARNKRLAAASAHDTPVPAVSGSTDTEGHRPHGRMVKRVTNHPAIVGTGMELEAGEEAKSETGTNHTSASDGESQRIEPYPIRVDRHTGHIKEEFWDHTDERHHPGMVILAVIAVVLLLEVVVTLLFTFNAGFRKNAEGFINWAGPQIPGVRRFFPNDAGTGNGDGDAQAAGDADGKGAEEAADTVTDGAVRLMFGGDVYLSDYVLNAYQSKGDITGVVSKDYLDAISHADFFMANEEFPFSTRGEAAENKQYTFRVDPSNVNILNEMGLKLVTLANNHTLDFGEDALGDTIETLENAGIQYVGAGKNQELARRPLILNIKGKTFAFFGCTRVMPEINWAAGENDPGLFSAYDNAEQLTKEIKDVRRQVDYVVVYMHWGEERAVQPNSVQTDMGHALIDAGADLVVGAHPHVLQGIEYYNGKPIVYSLGNFVFGSSIPSTALLEVTFGAENGSGETETEAESGSRSKAALTKSAGQTSTTSKNKKQSSEEDASGLKLRILPGTSSNGSTVMLTDAGDIRSAYDAMAQISNGISIDDKGYVHEGAALTSTGSAEAGTTLTQGRAATAN
jgi:hypothetical protein